MEEKTGKDDRTTYEIRPMTLADLEQVVEIDRLSFSLPWPESAFRYELAENPNSSCYVVEARTDGKTSLAAMAVVWWVVDEAHIATIAVHPQHRGLGLGKFLLEYLLSDALERKMLAAMLEVRAGNQIALRMYRNYGFEEVGRRPHYYQDNQEDAVLMTLDFKEVRNRRAGRWGFGDPTAVHSRFLGRQRSEK